ncbi:MAG TPA: discoidin domain-containing protein, partial [Phycisphaerae bacterium]|nr:discoidin domain-containing protein [Phycisphaerae bacterium]
DPTLVNGLSLTSANDWSQRDPASYELYGSNDGINFELIASGAVPAFSGRFTGQVFAFDNDVPYYQYALSFPTIVDPSTANSMQIAEIQLLGQTVPEPLTLTLSALAAGALGGYIRRRRR